MVRVNKKTKAQTDSDDSKITISEEHVDSPSEIKTPPNFTEIANTSVSLHEPTTPLDFLVREAHEEKEKMDAVAEFKRQENKKDREEKIKSRRILDSSPNKSENDTFDEEEVIPEEAFETITIDKIKYYVCNDPKCDKKFPTLSRVRRHAVVHSGIRPYECLNAGCNKRFSRKDNMLQHHRNHCNMSKKKKFKEYEPEQSTDDR